MRKRISQVLNLGGWTVASAGSGEEALRMVDRGEFDVIALDMALPDTSGVALLRRIRESDQRTCVVMLTSEGDLARSTEATETGADDFIEKTIFEPFQGLDFRLRHAHQTRLIELERRRISEQLRETNESLREANSELERLSQTDALTRLHNRRVVEDRLRQEIDRSARYGHWVGVGILDLDHFKRINDTYGHQTGDEVLVDFGRVLSEAIRSPDTAGRYGGEEFIVVYPETDLKGVKVSLERIRRAVARTPLGPPSIKHSITISCGGSATQPSGRDGEALLITLVRQADKALYEAKEAGRNRVATLAVEAT